MARRRQDAQQACFGSIHNARAIGHGLFGWYNNAHHHRGLRYLTPGDVHDGRAALILQVRHQTRLAAHAAHPERFVQGPPRLETLPAAVWINPPATSTRQDAAGAAVVTPDDPQPRVMFGSDVIVGDRSIVRVNSVDSLHEMRNQVVSKSLTRPGLASESAWRSTIDRPELP